MRRWLPDTLFGRLALLLGLFVVVSHVLVLALLLPLGGRPPPPPAGPAAAFAGAVQPGLPLLPPGPPGRPPGSLTWPLLGDIALRLAILLAATWIAARWLSEPIGRLARAAQQFGRQTEIAPLAETGPAECRNAARVFNQMQQRIRRQLDERHRFVAAVSHDLRTPLTRLRLRAESLGEAHERDRMCADIEEMDRMIAATLDYLRGAAGPETPQPVDMQALVQSIAEDQQACTHDVVASGAAGLVVAPPSALRRCIVNLVDNAVRYGGAARLVLDERDGRVAVEVRDPGPGIPVTELEQVFEPFHRVERSRNARTGGAGLGLSIARDIAAACGGRIELRNLDGSGFMARLELPRHERPAGEREARAISEPGPSPGLTQRAPAR